MRKALLGLALVLGTSNANAAGLYLSAGYGQADPDMVYTTTTNCSNPSDGVSCSSAGNLGYNSSLLDLAGFPNGYKLADYNATTKIGYQAADWDAGLKEKYDYDTKNSTTMSFAVGWDISQNPFRFELEYQKTKFKSPGYAWNIYDPNGNYYAAMYQTDATGGFNQCLNGICINPTDTYSASVYNFDVSFYQDMTASVDAFMANVFFEIPGLGPVDPYIGFGYGKAKVNFDFTNPKYVEQDTDGDGIADTVTFVGTEKSSGGSDGYVNAKQFIIGVEYRFDETPFIAGIEYRQFKVDFDERDEKDPYNLEHKYVMFKLRYDFISDEF